MPSKIWRFIPYDTFEGSFNMAVDEAILEHCIAGAVPPTLRLYGFEPPTVTIGLNQKMPPDMVATIKTEGFDVVRRPTGGRAVLHLDDLTYSFVGIDKTIEGGFLSTGVTESYKEISSALMLAFAKLGITSELGSTGTPYRHLQDCFKATTGADLHHDGTKLIGSAQTRRRGCVLQHGSAPLCQDKNTMPRLLNEAIDINYERHRNIFEVAQRKIPMDEFESAFKLAFEERFGVTLELGALTIEEIGAALQNCPRFMLETPQPCV